jgi:hypothetical protein
MKTLILAAIRCSLMFTAVTASVFCVRAAGAYTVTLQQVGSNVVATGSGAINLTGLTSAGQYFNLVGVEANEGFITTGATENIIPGYTGLLDAYSGFTGPASFGSGGLFVASTSSGDPVSIFGLIGRLYVAEGYVSGNFLSDSMTFNKATFASLGLTPGTYVWSWGDGGANQNFTLEIGSVPDGGSTVVLLGCALLGVAVLRRKLS